jgi:ribosomal protein S18 acetylase RimI-like enzyme
MLLTFARSLSIPNLERCDLGRLCYNRPTWTVGASMVVTTASEASPPWQGRLRPLEPVRDLGDVSRLISEAFASEMDERGQAVLRELRWMARLSPLVWWLSQVDPEFRDAFRGFVWEVPGAQGRGAQVVGNANVNRAPGNRAWYIVCNVVVAPEYRNRGIGRQLTAAATDEAADLGAQGVLLQVHRDNRPAVHVYTGLGFREVSGEAELWADEVPPAAVFESVGYRVRPLRPEDGSRVYELARRAVPLEQQWIRPIQQGEYWPDALSRLAARTGDLLANRRTYRLVALAAGQRSLVPVALASVTANFGHKPHRLKLLLDPEHAGQVETPLLSRALHLLATAPLRPVHASLFTNDSAALKVLESYGFRERRTLLTMRRDFR